MNAAFNGSIETYISPQTRAFLVRQHRLFIDGKWVEATDSGTMAVLDPATGRQIATAAAGGRGDIDLAVKAARRAFEQGPWRRTTTGDRGRLLWTLADLIEKHAEELAELDVLDEGSPYATVRNGYVADAIKHLRYYAGWATKINGQSVPVDNPNEWHVYTRREPVGVVGQIIPWNVPLLMAVWKISPALAAGCTIVLKPAEDTPLSAVRLGELVQEAGIPDGVLNIVTGDGSVGAALVEHPDVDKIAFTGSTATGKRIAQTAAGTLKRVSLELGGKSPIFVFPDADLKAVIPAAAGAVYLNSGQACTAGSRLYIHRKVHDEVVARITEYTKSLKLGHGLDRATDLGPLVSERQMNRVTGFLDEGRRDGATFVVGGERHGSEGFFVEPTVLTEVLDTMSIAREEIFGPVISAMRFDDDDDVEALVRRANATEYGLAASIWTSDVKLAHRMAHAIRAGVVWINGYNLFDPNLPFGGFKQSGWGREMGFDGLSLYTESKSVAVAL
ncbi:aldehyde dehydrogenase family protein [Mesorhizobium sp. B2-4-9]|uniref:aldehyde dehydrogenase family protein n=1 Tax=Mesorhizobium sp. B2-4-9 TaxID=2589940 RepID=UPI0011281523|nr:aldehyde dehydrogenase family protein [Mesorhizobium sp. B2-4-9]TPL21080.1 aldehyde dehydrogenase family protein [Mesorhizobium sp. B2-4-9]